MLLSTQRRWSATGAPAVAGAPADRRAVPTARAMQQQHQQQSPPSETPASRPREHLRVLRYPNGDERVIRYPAYAAEDGVGARASAATAAAGGAAATTTTASAATSAATTATTQARPAPAAGSGDSSNSGISMGGGGGGGGVASASLDDYLSWDVTGLWSSSSARPQVSNSGAAPPTSAAAAAPHPPLRPAEEKEGDEEAAAGPAAEADDATTASSPPADRPLSDADYLESLFAAAYASPQAAAPATHTPAPPKRGTSSRPQPQPQQAAEVGEGALPAGTYQVLTGCPWPVPRPLYTVALRHSASAAAAALASRLHPPQQPQEGGSGKPSVDANADDDRVGSTYTLSVRTRDRGAADDLARTLGKGPDWAARMDVGSRRDGVVAFGSERDARRFAALLESPGEPGGGHSGVAVARVDSHALFRATGDVKSVVVYLQPCTRLGGAGGGAGGGASTDEDGGASDTDDGATASSSAGRVPRPHELAAALLRGQ
jgi:hypothetical protein